MPSKVALFFEPRRILGSPAVIEAFTIDGQVFVRCQFIILDCRSLMFSQAFSHERAT